MFAEFGFLFFFAVSRIYSGELRLKGKVFPILVTERWGRS